MSLICNACQIQIHSDDERASHYKSEWHRYNVKRRCAGLASIPQALFESQLTALNNKKAAEASAKATQNCKTCKKSFSTASAFQAHIASKKHLKKVEKQGEGGPDDDDEDEDDMEDAPKSASAPGPSESKSEEDDSAMVEDGEDEEEEGEAIPLMHCLFCSKNYTQVDSCVSHMLREHGFFIPFIENLVDLEGLLTYLGEKIGIGHVCLWCNGAGRARYPSTESVQMHMKAKSHCKLRLEEDEDEEELMDFYDFDIDLEEGQYTQTTPVNRVLLRTGNLFVPPLIALVTMYSHCFESFSVYFSNYSEDAKDGASSSTDAASSSSSTALVAVKDDSRAPPQRAGGGGASGINEAGELVLADGSIIGSRQHKHIYKQHIRPSRDLVAIAAHYKQLALNTNVKQENPRIYRRKREAYHQRARKREDLAKGLHANFQFHFRAQVSY